MSANDDATFDDPYVYPGSRVLRNIPGKRTAEELELVEYRLTYLRRVELDEKPLDGPFDYSRLKETHWILFHDVYEWAGHPRTVEISKGDSQFHPSPYIDVAATQTFGWLFDSGLLKPDVDDEHFVRLSSDLMEKLNYIHPFREGNGRTQRAFIDQIAGLSGRTLSWRNVSREDHLRASVNAFREGNGEAFHSILRQVMRPPIDGLSPLDPNVYKVSEPMISRSASIDADLRQQEFYRRFPELRAETTAQGADE